MKRIFLPFPLGSRQGTIPKLTAKSNCRFEVEWVTEYACHRDYLESQNCSLSSAQHDVAVNLQPLSRVGGERGALGAGAGPGPSAPCPGAGAASQTGGSVALPHLCALQNPFSCVPPLSPASDSYYTSEADEYMYYLSICGGSQVSICSKKDAAVCQVKKADSTQVKAAGRPENLTLRCVQPPRDS